MFVYQRVPQIHVFFSIDLGQFHHDLTVLPHPENYVFFVFLREIIPCYGPTIQFSEVL